MNRIIFTILGCFLLISCGEMDLYFTLNKVIKNNSSKTLFYNVHTGSGSDSAYVYKNDSISFIFETKKTVKKEPFGFLTEGPEPPYISTWNETLYCIEDTLICSFSKHNFGKKDSIYDSKLLYITDDAKAISVILIFPDSIMPLMHKDYSMLEKFPEYYSK